MSLAARLPVFHPYAGGYPGLGSQTVPTDSDAIDYLQRMAAVDASSDGVEVGVATAVDAFFGALKATPGLFEAIKASCILCGARTITGALVPLAGTAPTSNGFVSGDYSRTAGLKGDGTSYLDSGRAGDDDPADDHHQACYATETSAAATHVKMGAADASTGGYEMVRASDRAFFYSRNFSAFFTGTGLGNQVGFYGYSRTGSTLNSRAIDTDYTTTRSVVGSAAINIFVFGQNNGSGLAEPSQGRMAFYSIGTSLSLEDLDTAVTNLITAIGEAL